MNQSPTTTSDGLYPWHQQQWSFISRCLEMDRLAHALIIEGPSGCGKTSFANNMAAKLLCNTDQPQACGQCRSCQLLAGEDRAHPEFMDITFEINPKTGKLRTEITVDQIRNLIGQLQLTNTISARKIAFIHPADALNKSAANALLKSLEEPVGKDTVLILVTDDPGRLPVTVRSRCQVISIGQPDREVVEAWLQQLSGKNGEVVNAAIDAAGGSPLRAAQFLESPEMDAFTQVRESLAMLLGSPASAMAVSEQLAKLDERDIWRWLSGCSSDVIRANMRGQTPGWIPANIQLDSKTLLQLQKQADINRHMSTTPVRSDLLLQSWLIGWAEQGI